ncbi:hypothetical protein C0993_002871 [Termitomyces sp. T159_Od127]|nr:hypothetical protein C0993_002871 [Termitomyces sp. T159_Od127]
MPSKPTLRMRTWGTRFDTLPTSPPLSPPAAEPAATDAPEPPATDPVPKKKDEKMPHDASVFVGSLPSNIDQQELTRLLSEHLSEHTEVKNIKVVRDSKVPEKFSHASLKQDAASAASLINTLHSNTPKQFLGRSLRYEPARAFRTLLISYRTPMQNSLDASSKPQAVELNLPTAMRIWRSRNPRFYSLLYNNDAVEAENNARNDLADTSDKPSLFLEPVVFDAERQPENRRNRSASLTLSKKDTGSYSVSCLDLQDDKESRVRGQELDIPSTPGLGRSPLTPKTPGFPLTPTTTYNALQSMSPKDGEGRNNGYFGDAASRDRDIDPTTLFVGGLETFGPGAWDEEKVTKFFARFGGLEEVKIVRPLNSHAAFAFVKFNNTEAPARAVFEEHNRVYEGRAMRVQLRDCNPPRGSWRHNRGRGYVQQKLGPHRRAPEDQADRTSSQDSRLHDGQNQAPQSSQEDKTVAETEFSETEPPVYTEIAASKVSGEATEGDEVAAVPSSEATTSSSNGSMPFTTISTQPSENYREWYDEPLSTTPSLSTSTNPPVSMPTSTPGMPYPVPGTYFTPTPWIQPYGQPMQFHMPYVGFPGYSFPNQSQMPPQFQRPPGSDGNAASVPGTWSPMGMYGAPPTRTPTVDPTPSQPNLNNKAPLYPTGFIQNEQGTLIAVYQPEALDQYMAGAPIVPPPQYPAQNLPNWIPHSQPAGYPPPGPPTTTAMPARPLPSNGMAWIPNQGFASQQQAHSTPHIQQTPHLNSAPGGPRGGYPESGGQTGGPSFRRHPGRRDQGGPHNNHTRNSQPRSFQNRNARGNMPMNGGYHGGDTQSGLRNSHSTGTEWSPWGATAPR